MKEVQSQDGNLIFMDYQNRKVIISHEDYLNLIVVTKRQEIRPVLEECLAKPSEIWLSKENVDGKEYYFYKYIKVYSNLVFIAYILLDEAMNLLLNNFYGYEEDEFEEAEKERSGQLIHSDYLRT